MKHHLKLFSPITLNRLTLKNRVVMPAMHLNYTPGGKVNDKLIEFYRERAKGGAGLIIVGGCIISRVAGGPTMVSIQKDEDIEGLKELTDACKDQGAAIGAQLYHAGAYSHRMLIADTAVSSSVHTSAFTKEEARALSLEEIPLVQDEFAQGARRAKQAGFDMVEILGSAGYLICQFLSPKINRREDEYGGAFENRMRFGLETIAKVREAVGPDYCVGIRIAGNDFVPGSHTGEETALFAKAAVDAGVDLINVTGGWHETKIPQLTEELPPAGFAYLARNVRRGIGAKVPVCASNRIPTAELAEDILAREDADLICMGRPLLADPELPNKSQNGRSDLVRQCVACNQGCFDAIMQLKPVGCMVNPMAGHEAKPNPPKPSGKKKLVVVGGGPAGCQAALTAAERGHEVVLFEAGQALGGQPAWYSGPLRKKAFSTIGAWQKAGLTELGVDVRLGVMADVEALTAEGPDQVILATGGRPMRPAITGADGHHVVTAWDLLKGKARVNGPVAIIGGGATGLETALFAARQGALTPEQLYFLSLFGAEDPARLSELVARGSNPVTVIEMLPKIGQGIGRSTRWIVYGLLKRFGVKVHTKAKVTAIQKDRVLFSTPEKEMETLASCVVLAAGFEPETTLAKPLKNAGVKPILIGDANGGGSILKAISQGYQAALSL